VSKNIVHSFLWRMVISIKMAPSTGSAWSRRTTCVQFTGLAPAYYQSFGKFWFSSLWITYFQFLICFPLRCRPFSFLLIFILDVVVPSRFPVIK